MASYYRPNGSSRQYLRRSLDSIVNQTATNWHIYLVGDKYEDNAEFEELAKTVSADKITYMNLPNAPERENLTGLDRWRVAGSNAFNCAHTLALSDGCDYLLHVDDDDVWLSKKIQVLNYICYTFDNPVFLFHYSTYMENTLLPPERFQDIQLNNLLVMPSNAIHSSFCAHKSVMSGFSYSGYYPGKTSYIPGDIQFIMYLHEYISNTKSNYIFIPFLLCNHDIEMEFVPKGEIPIAKTIQQIWKETRIASAKEARREERRRERRKI